ncbi:MAG: TspO/MBR family protein [Candidatus Staskawiczbacteria bacterium]|nr:TspO/MBR family protein [Candidatus Staskawiczbacteria bacterium]
MKFNKVLKLLASIIICEMAGVVGTFFTTPEINSWYSTLNKPAFNPPSWVFGPVWTALFVLMGVSLYLVWSKDFSIENKIGSSQVKSWNKWSDKFWNGSWQKANIILIFGLQLVLNVVWSAIFFGAHNIGAAFFELLMLWVAIVYTIANFYRVSKWSAYLLVPYIVWVTFAGVLNVTLWLIN